MPTNTSTSLIFRFAGNHFYTEGKFVNTLQAAEQIGASRLALNLTNGYLDETCLDKSDIDNRLSRVRTVIAKLRHRGISADLVLPSLTGADKNATSGLLKFLYRGAADTQARTLWIDDIAYPQNRRFNRKNLMAWFRTIGQTVHTRNPRIRLGLMASFEKYAKVGTTAEKLAGLLAGGHPPLLGLVQPLIHDYHRIDILKVAQYLATVAAARAAANTHTEILGVLDNRYPSTFHKSAQAVEVQINLNLLFGVKQMMLNCFDLTGTAPGSEDAYLNMQQHHHRLMGKLGRLLPERPQHEGLCLVVPERPGPTDLQNPWPIILWRLGLAVTMATPATVSEHESAFILTGDLPKNMKRQELKHIFSRGVLLDAQAALTIQEMGWGDMLGVKVGGPISRVQTEILTDQSFAAPYYGQRIVVAGHLTRSDFHRLSAVQSAARPITTFEQKNRRPDTNGMFIFDDRKNNQRCAVLAYSLDHAEADFMLLPARRRHFQDLFGWLGRRRLNCFVESSADLAPFYIRLGQRRRIILALVNVGFDRALDSRIRFGGLPFAVKRVRKLNEQGKIVEHKGLKMQRCRDYQYLHLTGAAAVGPLQMTILLLEG